MNNYVLPDSVADNLNSYYLNDLARRGDLLVSISNTVAFILLFLLLIISVYHFSGLIINWRKIQKDKISFIGKCSIIISAIFIFLCIAFGVYNVFIPFQSDDFLYWLLFVIFLVSIFYIRKFREKKKIKSGQNIDLYRAVTWLKILDILLLILIFSWIISIYIINRMFFY